MQNKLSQSSDSLYTLIKGLTKAEKGYFKKMATAFSGNKESNYLQLFDAIDKQSDYDEGTLLKKFRNEKFVKQFSVAKTVLFNQIMKALRQFNSNHAHIAINNHLENAQILFERLLPEEAIAELERARKIANSIERPLKLLEVMFYERRFYYDTAVSNWDELIKTNIEKELSMLQQMLAEAELSTIYYELQRFIRYERYVRTPEQEQFLDELMQSNKLKLNYATLGFESRIRYNMSYKIYYQLKNQDQESLKYMRLVIQEYENNPEVIQANAKRYLLALNNYLSICAKMSLIKDIDNCLNSVSHKLFETDLSVKVLWFEIEATFSMSVLVNTGRFDQLEKLLDRVSQEVDNYAANLNAARLLVLYYNIMTHYFVIGRYNSSLVFANRILETKNIELRKDMFAHTRIYYLMIHYELGNVLVLESVIRAARNFLQTREVYYEMERVFIRHIAQLSNCADNETTRQVFIDLINAVNDVAAKKPLEKSVLQAVDIHNWAEAHIQEMPLREYIKVNDVKY